jgi:predicted alpha/beta-fold hydrolase
MAAARAEAEWARDCFYSFDSPASYLDHTLDFRRHQEMRRIVTGAYEAPPGAASPASPLGPAAAAAASAAPTPVLAPTKVPVVLLFPGLTSGSDDGNACCLAQAIAAQGWHVVMPIRRGCCDDPSLTTKGKYYAYGGLEDSTHVVEHVARTMPGHPLFAVGLSAGSNVAVNYVASAGRFSQVLGCVSVANGFCWQRGTRALARDHPVWDVVMTTMVRARLFTRFKKNIVARQRHTFSDAAPSDEQGAGGRPDRVRPTARQRSDVPEDEPQQSHTTRADDAASGVPSGTSDEEEEVLGYGSARWGRRHLRTMLGDMLKSEAATIRKHDELITRRLHGFTSLEEFYAEQGCVHRLHRVKVPTVFFNALNDPVASGANVPVAALRRHPHVLTVLSFRGGHLGYPESLNPFYGERRSYMDRFVVDALRAVMQEAKLRMRQPEIAAPTAGEAMLAPPAPSAVPSALPSATVGAPVSTDAETWASPASPASPITSLPGMLMKGARRSSGWVAATPTMAMTSATVVAPLTRPQSRADIALF